MHGGNQIYGRHVIIHGVSSGLDCLQNAEISTISWALWSKYKDNDWRLKDQDYWFKDKHL